MAYTIVFKTQGGRDYKCSAEAGANLLEVAQAAGVDVDAPCSGNGTCGKCLVRIMAGAVDSAPHYKLPEEAYADNWRLLCQSKVLGDCTIWVPLSAGSDAVAAL